MVMICPYCDIEINDKMIEAEDGCCPECGALLTPSNVLNEEDEDKYDDEYDDDLDADFGEGRGSDQEYDEFDEFLEEEKKYNKRK